MGTDIHTALEVKIGGAWTCLTTIEPYDDDDSWLSPKDSIADDRNYGFFAAMADVRNGFGFAGCDTGDAITPIAMPRGIPEDLSPEVQAWYNQGIEHTPSWHTLADILAYDWTQPRTQRGWVTHREWARYACAGQPDAWSGDISGGMIVHVPPSAFALRWAEAKRHFNLPEQRWAQSHLWHPRGEDDEALEKWFLEKWDGKRPYTQVQWTRPLYDSMGHQMGELMAEMLAVSIKHGVPHEDVRIVFYFDS
jgi:hypothetical protein